jgi:hypothetical protein
MTSIVRNPDPKTHSVLDYEIKNNFGQTVVITVYPEINDTVERTENLIRFTLVPRPMTIKPGETWPGETIEIYLNNVFAITTRPRTITDATVEQKEEWLKTIQELTKDNPSYR